MMAAYYAPAQIETYDIRLLVSNKEIWAHKEVLASGSEFFKRKFCGSWYSGKPVYELQDVKYEILCEIVNFIYTGKIDINPENVCDVYKEAEFFYINLLKKPCLDFMEDNIDVDNCVKIWSIANTYKHEKLLTAAGIYIFPNLEIVSDKIEFLNLSNKEILDLFKRCPEHKIFDSFVICANKWSAKKENWEETAFKILEVIPQEKLRTNLFNYFLITKSDDIKWFKCLISAVFKPETNILDTILSSYEAAKKYSDFVSKKPIVFMTGPIDGIHKFHKYDCQSREFNLWYTKKFENQSADDFISYKNYIYALRNESSVRFTYDDLNENGYESAFRHEHDKDFRTTIMKDSMYIIGGVSSEYKGSIVDLNTQKITSFSLLDKHTKAGVAVNDGSIYICGGLDTDMIERFDPREGKISHFGNINFEVHVNNAFCCAAALPNRQLYISNGIKYKMIDTRNRTYMRIESPDNNEITKCLFSSYNKLYTVTGRSGTVYEYQYIDASYKWKNLGSFKDLSGVYNATSFESFEPLDIISEY